MIKTSALGPVQGDSQECISANSVSIERLPVRCGFHSLHDLFCLMLAGATWPSATHAQVSIDMARVTCADYLALSAANSASSLRR